MDFSTIVIAMILGIIPGVVASKKGYSFLQWWIFGSLLFIVALPLVLIKEPTDIIPCPYCSESIKDSAVVCKHCNKEIETQKGEV